MIFFRIRVYKLQNQFGRRFVSPNVEVLTCMQEAGTGFASKPQTDDAEPGDIALDSWVRYDDPEVDFAARHVIREWREARYTCSHLR